MALRRRALGLGQGQLDELLKVIGPARTDLRRIDREEPEEIEAHRRAESRRLEP